MNDETRKTLIEVLQASEENQEFVRGMDFKAYQNNAVIERAVERDFEIIGEALNRVKYTDNELLQKISEHHRSIKFFIKNKGPKLRPYKDMLKIDSAEKTHK